MVNKTREPVATAHVDLGAAPLLVGVYVAISVATLAGLAVLSALAPVQATSSAWGHAVVVVVFAVLLPLRVRAAARGSVRALGACMVISVVVLVVNVVEAALPHAFPVWMRVDMLVVAATMLALSVVLARVRR